MKTLAARRNLNRTITFVVAALLLAATAVYRLTLEENGFFTGWILFTLIVILAGYNIRKKLSMVPVGPASNWLQFHLYAGVIAIIAFFLHIDWQVPNGPFEVVLAIAFVLVAGTGVLGIFLNRSLARRLAQSREEAIFERIPALITKLRETAEEATLNAVSEGGSMTIRDFYINRLSGYFAGPQHVFEHLFGSNRTFHKLSRDISALERYLDDTGRGHLAELRDLVDRKHDLDVQYAYQLVLKGWLFVHVPATAVLLIAMILHVVLVYGFTGGF